MKDQPIEEIVPAENTRRLLSALERIATALEAIGSVPPPLQKPPPRPSVQAKPPTAPDPKPMTIPECPKCGEPMLLRKRKADDGQFWGCRDFPDCRGIIGID